MSTICDSAMDTHIPEKEESILCRLCLNTCRSAVNIFTEGEGLRLCEIINEIMQLDVSKDEGLPGTVCEGCCGKVRDFKDFKSLCIESRRELVSRLCGTRNQGEVIKACTSKSPCSTTTNTMCTPSESVVGEGKRENCLEGIPGTPSAVEGAASNCVEGEAEGMAKSLEERKTGCSPATADDWASESEESQDQPSSDEDSLPSRILRSRKRQQRRNLRSLRNSAVKDGYVEPKFVPGYVLARELLYECPFCGRIYETKRGLTHHLSTIHDQPMAQCSKKSRKTDVLALKPSVTKDLDPLSAKWGLKECSVVLTDVFPGGVGDTKPNPLALGGVRNTETSDLRKVRIDRNGVVNVNGVACDDGSGKTGGDEDCGSDLGFGECGRTSSRGSVCDKHSVMSCRECSGHEGEGSALRDGGKEQCEPSSEAPSDGDCRTSPRKTNDATLGRVKTENDQRSDNYTNPFFGRCIMILDEADDESRDASSACSRTDGQSAVRKVPEDKTCTSNSATTWMVCDQSPGCSRDGETSSMDCEMDPLMLEESSSSEVEESGGEGGETDSLAGSCARAQVWPHLILRQKHDIETLSDISDDDDRGEALEQQSILPTEDSQEEIIVEAVVHRGASSVEPLPIRVESTSSLSRWETVDDHPEKSSPAPTTSYVDNLTRLHQYLVNPSSYNIQHPSLACSVCGVECQDKPQLDVHILMMHTGPPRIGCSVCGAQCRNETELDEHMRSMHEQPQRFVCSMCSWTFARESLLMQHVSFHCKDGGFMCLVCRAMHATGEELLRHTKYVHAGLAQHRGLEEGKGDEMRAKGLYKEVVNNPLTPYVMSDVVSSHLVPSTVQERVETLQWQQVNPPPCQDTNNAFSALAPVDQEMIQVESVSQGQVVYDTRTNGCYTLSTGNEKKYVCKFCSLETRHKSSLYRHILRQHVGGKRMSCAHCQRTFSNSDNLVAHQKLHSEEWPYRCTLCVKVFKTSRYLKRHMVIHAKEASVAAAWAGGGDGQQATNKGLLMWFACTLCGRAYQNKASLKEHFKVEHGNFNLFECAHCGQRFADYGLLCDHSKICGAVGEPCNKAGGVMVEPAA